MAQNSVVRSVLLVCRVPRYSGVSTELNRTSFFPFTKRCAANYTTSRGCQVIWPCWVGIRSDQHVDRHGRFLCRSYASKNIKKEKKGAKTLEVPTDEMEEIIPFKEYEASLRNLVEEFRDVLSKQFSLRTNAASLESVIVDLGTETHPLPEIAQISFKNAQTIMINLAATPTYLKPVVKALQDSGLNLNPQTEGKMIYIPVPK